MNLKDTYNRIAEDWHKDHHDDTWWVEGTDAFISLLPKGASVLDVGCGTGNKSKYLESKGLSVMGIDFSEGMIAVATREVPTVPFVVMDIKDMSAMQQSFDGILAQAVLLHIPRAEMPPVINELKAKLKDDGLLYIAVKEKWPDGEEEGILKEEDNGYQYERFFSYFTLDEIRKYLSDASMSICYEDVARTGRTNWIQIVARK